MPKDKGNSDSFPFAIINEEGVDELFKMSVHRGKSIWKELKTCICGEKGGEIISI